MIDIKDFYKEIEPDTYTELYKSRIPIDIKVFNKILSLNKKAFYNNTPNSPISISKELISKYGFNGKLKSTIYLIPDEYYIIAEMKNTSEGFTETRFYKADQTEGLLYYIKTF